MLPSLLITFREVIEAALIVATILGILTKLGRQQHIKTVWLATAAATLVSVGLLAIGSIIGIKVQTVYTGAVEELIEGVLMITSAVFITWAVFFLHKYFGKYKTELLAKVRTTIEDQEKNGLFILVFTAVFREGFEIVLFLSTIYLSSNPQSILLGFGIGSVLALLLSFALFSATLRMPVFYAFRVTSVLLILFAAGLLARGVHEFAEIGLLPEIGKMMIPLIPESSTITGGIIKAIFGITQSMDAIQLTLYGLYTAAMSWYVFVRKTQPSTAESSE